MQFPDSHKKIERANKHIADIQYLLLEFTNDPSCYTATIKFDAKTGQNFLRIAIREDLFPGDDVALTIGDALHNLRSALDLMYYQIVLGGDGEATDWTRFPIEDTREALVGRWLTSALKQKQISVELGEFIVEKIKPYAAGNLLLWVLHDMNVTDKHKLLVPVAKLVAVLDIHLEDDKGRQVGDSVYYMDESCDIRLRDANNRKVTVKDKGKASAVILLGEDTPLQGQTVIKTLTGISEEVRRTVEAFERLGIVK